MHSDGLDGGRPGPGSRLAAAERDGSPAQPQESRDRTHCAECGALLPAGVPRSLCSRCVLAGALKARWTPKESAAVPLPQTFGDYELLEEIARGGMGVVYKARQTSLGRLVAVKMLLFGTHASADVIRRFRAEAVAAGSLQHPNIVAIHEVGIHDDQPFIVMDYVEGPNLSNLLKERPLTPRTAAHYVKTIAEAIHYAHEQGILHRDLKPSNVLVDRKGQPHVTDFGLAKGFAAASPSSWAGTGEPRSFNSEITDEGSVLGSPAYMPPEQAAGKRAAIGPWSDVYSLGAMLYHLLTGRPPFVTESISEALDQVIHADPVSPRALNRAVPRDLETICLKCLEKDPHRRYATALELAEDLGRWIALKPVRAHRAGLVVRSARWIRRNPAGAALVISLFAGLAVALALLSHVAQQRTALRGLLADYVNQLWKDPDKSFDVLRSETMAKLIGKSSPPAPDALRIVIGVNASIDPIKRAEQYHPITEFIERRMAKILQRPVRADLALMKPGRVEKEALLMRRVDISRIGALSFEHLQREDPNITALVQEVSDKSSAIFARTGLNIHTIQDLRGRSFGVADKDATVSLWAKMILLGNGISSSNLGRLVVLDGNKKLRDQINAEGLKSTMSRDWNSHNAVISGVLAGVVEAGAARIKNIAEYVGKQLVIIQEYDTTPNLWVARSNLPQEVIDAARTVFLEIGQSSLMRHFPNQADTFEPVNRSKLDVFSNAVYRVETEFDPTPGKARKSEEP